MSSNAWDLVMRTLQQWDVRAVFGLPNDDLAALQAVRRHGLRWILTRDQRNAMFMAGGQSLASGRLSVCVVGKGPALGNALTGLLECQSLSAPVLLLATGTAQESIGNGAFQEADQMAMVRPLVKWAYRVEQMERLGWALQRAAFLAVNGQPGPVYVELPENLATAPAGKQVLLPSPPYRLLCTPEVAVLQEAWYRLKRAQRPILLLGGGALAAARGTGLYERLAERNEMALFTTASGRGAVAESHSLFCGLAGIYTAEALRELWFHADLVLVLGSRLEETALALLPQISPDAQWIQVDVEPSNFSHRVESLKLMGDAAACAEHWLSLMETPAPAAAAGDQPAKGKWLIQIARLRRQAHADCSAYMAELPAIEPGCSGIRPADVVRTLHGIAPPDTVFVHENGLADMWSYFYPYFALRDGQCSIVPSEQTTLGFGAAAAIGVKLARPNSPVMALVGDGAFNLFRSDLCTAPDHELPVIYLVFNNSSYGWLERQWQQSLQNGAPHICTSSGFGFNSDLNFKHRDIVLLPVRHREALSDALIAAFDAYQNRQTVVVDVQIDGIEVAPALGDFYG
ncbi:thiamine pyrophosphate-binding protein [Comamonas sp. GB3 AK4-5]|uniref:thiamine pyrophosphate-binding protein n=1 Tax=Comamonas sp. GB3 AK4-5 TaxID=3231487 RepID=UPI00351DC3B6